MNPTLWAGGSKRTDPILRRNAAPVYLQVAGIEEPHIIAIDDCAARITTMLVIGHVRIQRIGVMTPPLGCRERRGRMPPPSSLRRMWKAWIMLVEHMQCLAVHEKAIRVIQSALWR
ncbi:hypothetical protein HMPREF2985_01120 [Corynebacterium sp. HMSC072B09]|nr:hypothetical protein HMPREF1206_00783 [Corynebacterium sp. HFH0082]OFL69536.1 hypothetical protein HMPREF2752_03285 [Corynebacterium sp. HMSC077C02]OFM54149.1 hypothetical protein HMPREF2681_09330 [Corynebacterium sp. HMSC064H12]OFQ02909.1 hypothetical protein HMPREF2960_03785 [Corynebacterium sp. HMSC070B05]OHR25873.1 hypothetical protein HMPREF2985_01120 [Corynebacterium sp. HMSC072B09]OHR27010.1 hypothetical protein HMPREF2849_06790 [Corynebacterium sp. HMSC073B01]